MNCPTCQASMTKVSLQDFRDHRLCNNMDCERYYRLSPKTGHFFEAEREIDVFVTDRATIAERNAKYHSIPGWADGYTDTLDSNEYQLIFERLQKLAPGHSNYHLFIFSDEMRIIHAGSICKRDGKIILNG